MALAFGFDIGEAEQGAVFMLNLSAKSDRKHPFQGWHAELHRGTPYLCMRGGKIENKPLDSIVAVAHRFAEDALDIVAVEERVPLLVPEPHDGVVWRRDANGLKVQLTTSITFMADPLPMHASVRDASGNIVPAPPYVPPQHHVAYRYFRYSQAASNVFDAYRNMFLALECVLDHVAGKQNDEGETDWLVRALGVAMQQHGADLNSFINTPGMNPVHSFVDAHYSAVRCAIFHAKNSGGRQLRPGALESRDVVLHQLLAVQKLVEHLFKSIFAVRLPSGGFFHSGFGHLLSQLEPVTHMFVGPTDCPTVDELLQGGDNLPDGVVAKVRFAGLRTGTTDEWLFVSEIKCPELPFSSIGALRLVAHVPDQRALGVMGMLLIPIMDKMKRTLLLTELDLHGVSKLVIRVRCVLRNTQQPRRGFAS
jgi:hypothetical protein